MLSTTKILQIQGRNKSTNKISMTIDTDVIGRDRALKGPNYELVIVSCARNVSYGRFLVTCEMILGDTEAVKEGDVLRVGAALLRNKKNSLVDIMRPYSDKVNYPQVLEELWKEELEKCKDFEYWFNHYYTPLSVNKWRQ